MSFALFAYYALLGAALHSLGEFFARRRFKNILKPLQIRDQEEGSLWLAELMRLTDEYAVSRTTEARETIRAQLDAVLQDSYKGR